MTYTINWLFFLILVFTAVHAQQPAAKPNVILILADDLGWADLSCMGSTVYETPNIDRLAAQGMLFKQFYSGGPVCSPGRAALLTGKYTARTGITNILITPAQDPDYVTHQLDLSELTLGEAFLEQQYATGYFGKWHLGYKMQYWAANQGFQTAIGGSTSSNDWLEAYPGKKPPVPLKQLETYNYSPYYFTHMKDGPVGENLTERLTNETIAFITHNRNKPFFAFLSYHAVHDPYKPKRENEARFRKKINELGIPGIIDTLNGSRKYQNLPAYAAMVYELDYNIGRLLQKVNELGLQKNTIVIFTSDNGGVMAATSNAPLKGAKWNLYEGGIRVPFIVRYPLKIKAGTRSEEPLIFNDVYPTLLTICNLPPKPLQHVDGVSFTSILTGRDTSIHREALYWHFPHAKFEGAVRWKNYKLIYNYISARAEIYDLSLDIGEQHDLSAVHPDLVLKMKSMLGNWLKATHARFPKEGMTLP